MARYHKQIVSKKELKTLCGIPYSPVHIARLEAAGQFPQRIRLGQNRVAWLLSEIEAWIDERLAQRAGDTNFLKVAEARVRLGPLPCGHN